MGNEKADSETLSALLFEIERSLKLSSYQALNSNAVKGGIVFVGDSITDGFPIHEMLRADRPMYNRGISGDTTLDVWNKLQHVVLDLNPDTVFLHIGSNDLPKNEQPDNIVKRIGEICTKIQAVLPNVQIFIQSLDPVNPGEGARRLLESPYPIHTMDEANAALFPVFGLRTNEAIQQINAGLLKLASEQKLNYVDLFEKLINDEGQLKPQFTYDGLHLTVKGYEVVAEVIQNIIGTSRPEEI